MAAKYNFIMDPSGDVLLSLSNANELFAVWQNPVLDKLNEPEPVESKVPVPEPTPEPVFEPLFEPLSESLSEPVSKPAPKMMTFLLSSRHLSLASPVLKAMLSGAWSEGMRDESDGLFRLHAEDWDSEALVIVMNAVHGRWSLVPRTVSLEILAKIATIVDYYDIREALQLILSHWMEGFTAWSVPRTLCRETVLWILISWVFKDAAIFGQATKIAILLSTQDLVIPDGVPIPFFISGTWPSIPGKAPRHYSD